MHFYFYSEATFFFSAFYLIFKWQLHLMKFGYKTALYVAWVVNDWLARAYSEIKVPSKWQEEQELAMGHHLSCHAIGNKHPAEGGSNIQWILLHSDTFFFK